MGKLYSDLKNSVQDEIRNSSWIASYGNEFLRYANKALDFVNSGNTEKDNQLEVGYDFQRETIVVPFDHEITGTVTTAGTTTLTDISATFISDDVAPDDVVVNDTDGSSALVVSVDTETQLTISVLQSGTDNDFDVGDTYTIKGLGYIIPSTSNYKFPYELRLSENSDVKFEYVDEEYFNRKKYVSGSGESMFTIKDVKGSKILQVNYGNTEGFWLDYYSNNMVYSGSSRTGYWTGNDNDYLLMPDRFFNVIVTLTSAFILGNLKGWTDADYLAKLSEGRTLLKQMINNIGYIRKQPIRRMRVRNAWPRTLQRIKEDD